MIIVRISGGIGNQLFQYALGRALSLKNGDEFRLDTHCYDLNIEPDRSLKLYNFKVSTPIATDEDFKKIGVPNPKKQDLLSKMQRKIFRALKSSKPLSKKKMILESGFQFHPEISEIKGDCYLSGVWQSEKYFKGSEAVIRKDLMLKDPLSKKALELKALIDSSISISVHIRRGDQVLNPELLKKHGALTDEYYKNAVDYIRNNINAQNVKLFIFSDDGPWVKENMNLGPDIIYVSDYNLPDYEELSLMSLCKHNIVAKSSFSWWGAWLNRNTNKIVIAPKERFGSAAINAQDLIPNEWVKI